VSPFLAHLVGMALGSPSPGAARLSLPPRFAQAQAATIETSALSETPEQPAAAGSALASHTTDANLGLARSDQPHQTRGAPIDYPPAGDPSPQVALPLRALNAAIPSVLKDLPPTREANATAFHNFAAPQARPQSSGVVAPTLAPAGDAGTAKPPGARSSPLSAATMGARNVSPNLERPIINVTIDRLELRAPSSPKPNPEPRRAMAQPTLSLSEYLRGTDSGGRA